MLVDTHVHIYPPDIIKNAEEIAQSEPYFQKLISGKVHRWATCEDLLINMQKENVAESWVCGFAFQDMGLCRACNDYVLESVSMANGSLKGLCVVPPLHRDSLSEIERCAQSGVIGVGELFPDGQGWNIHDARQTWRIVGCCDDNALFLMIHSAEPVGHDYPGKGSVGPKEIVAFCQNHPESHVIFAHWGGGVWLYEAMPEIRRILKNARYDTAASPFLYSHNIYQTALNSIAKDKILYGTDFPLLNNGRFPSEEDLLSTYKIDRDVVAGYTHKNAMTFLSEIKNVNRQKKQISY